MPNRPLARLIVSAYAPTALSSIGLGAIMPLVPLTARELGASVSVAAFIVALLGVGQLIGDLPAGWIADRVGDKWALIGACLVDACALAGAFIAPNLVVLGLAVTVAGMSGAVFGLARQSYLTDAIPVGWRARALSSLGGTFRLGFFVGPLVGAIIISRWSLAAAYAFGAVMSLAAAAVTMALPDLPAAESTPASVGGRQAEVASDSGPHTSPQPSRLSTRQVLREHRHVLATLGTGVMLVMMARAARQSIIPLWAESQGVSPATTSVLFGVSSGVDLCLFWFGGAIMDRFGRVWVAMPSMVILGLGLVLLPLTHTVTTIGIIGILMGLGNGISAGIVMTLGSDASPTVGRAQFLSGWRLCGDAGNTAGPLVITAVAAVAPLAAASVLLGAVAWFAAGWLWRWVPRRG